MISGFFINRPILSIVMSLLIACAGLAAMRTLPIDRYPEIAPPAVSVQAIYPGASADVIEQTVAAPLENAINGIERMLYMNSVSSSSGTTTIQVFFELGTDIEQAVLNVNNRIKQVESRLPIEVRRQGITVTKNSSALMYVLGFYSPDKSRDDLYISNYVSLNVLDKIKRIPGTTNVQIFGAKDYAMRIWLRPDRLAQLKLSANDIIRALNEQNSQFAVGNIGTPPIGHGQEVSYTVTTQGRLSSVQEFEEIILRAKANGATLRLKDVARVELAPKAHDIIGRIDNQPAILTAIFLLPGANILATAKEVDRTMQELAEDFPGGLQYRLIYETTSFVEASINKVVKTILEAMLLVFLVVFLFLQNWRATLILFSAVPISLLGTFIGLYVFDLSINTLTLFGMVLSIGIVVDDAIVVLENVERIMHEQHLGAREATLKAMHEVTSPVIAIVLVLCAVFVPISFLGGLAGELYRQFAVTLSIAVVFSGFVALTLTPALCAAILKPEHKSPGRFFEGFNRWFKRTTDRYENGVAWLIHHGWISCFLFLVMVVLTVGLWRATPRSLVPEEDQGYFISAFILPDGASLERTDSFVQKAVSRISKSPFVEHAVSFSGLDFLGGTRRGNAATVFFRLKPWDERPMPAAALVGQFYGKTADMTEGLALAFNPPAIRGIGKSGGFELYIQNRGEGGFKRLVEVSQQFIARAAKEPKLKNVNTFWRAHVPQLHVELDRAKAKARGVDLGEIYSTLAATLGTYYVNDFNKSGRTWQVLLSAEPRFRDSPEDVGAIYVRSRTGAMVPLKSLARIEHSRGPDVLERFNNLPAVKIFGDGAKGVSSGEAISVAEQLAKEVLPPDFSYDWSGISFQEKQSGGSSNIALIAAVLMVFLILAALYERWSLPLSVILVLPFGTFGALLFVWLRGLTNDVYFQIGLITLLGLAARNAILIVEFAVLKTNEGLPASVAALEAARLRFRPILMTSLTFIFGVLPLAISTGAGAAAQRSAGTGVIGGMIAATFLAIFFVPFFFKLIQDRRIHEPLSIAELKAGAARSREKSQQKKPREHEENNR